MTHTPELTLHIQGNGYYAVATVPGETVEGASILFAFHTADTFCASVVRAVNEREGLIEALKMAAARFEDLAGVIEEHGSYDNAGFMQASADRCRAALSKAGQL